MIKHPDIRITPIVLAAAGLVMLTVAAYAQHISIPRIDQMPDMPSPYHMRDWKRVALAYDSLAFDLTRSEQYFPLVFLITNTANYPGQISFGLQSYVGDGRSETGEAINLLPAVVGATLCGANKRLQFGRDWVTMCQEYFNNRPEENVYLNEPVANSGSDWWYDVMPNVFFYQLASLHEGAGDFTRQFGIVADRWLESVYAMGGSLAPWSHPGLEHRGWYLATMTPNNETPHEPEAGGSIAWLLYHASLVTGNREYRYGAELCIEELNAYTTNPAYELQLAYGTYLAARMNGELGTSFNVEKMVNWCFDVSPLRSWGAVVGTWGGYDCSGLIGEVNGWNDYAFAMNTFEQIGALVPLVRYDPRFARAIGKWTLNAANASRLFYGAFLPDANQDSRVWSSQYDPGSVFAHEALRQRGPGQITPYATGDAIAGGWAPTNLSLYSSSHVGILGAIIDTTEVPGVLKLNLLATDYFHAPAYPTYLFYNPDTLDHVVTLAVGGGLHDVYNTVTKTFLAQAVSGAAGISIPARDAIVLVIAPSGGTVSYDEERMLIDGVVVDYRSGHVPSNHRPRIKGFGAGSPSVYLNGVSQLSCTVVDPDGDTVAFQWLATGGTVIGEGSTVVWTAPDSSGAFNIACMVSDGKGGSDTAHATITVVDSPLSVPVIREVVARPGKLDLGATTTATCRANDPTGRPLTYTWQATAGIITGTDSVVQWTAPAIAGNYTLWCSVDNGQGG
ncbi:MAG: laminin G, partial [Bacteroidetes bacterium]|nr:laminin G [Bacteroidota bacterium]